MPEFSNSMFAIGNDGCYEIHYVLNDGTHKRVDIDAVSQEEAETFLKNKIENLLRIEEVHCILRPASSDSWRTV